MLNTAHSNRITLRMSSLVRNEVLDLRHLRDTPEWSDWRWQTRHRCRTVGELLAAVNLPESAVPPSVDLLERFPLGVTPYYLALARRGDPSDPILRQVLPIAAEDVATGQEVDDPFEEEARSPVPGVIHRYPDRVLILPTNFCATLCRHCFRKRSWADGFFFLDRAALKRAAQYVRESPGVRDVLITGGDPLHLAPGVLSELLHDLKSIPHLEVVRVASRVPVTLPQRIDDAMIAALAPHRPLWFITHFNCEQEVSEEATRALRRLIDAGITVQNQTVLLRGVNDSTDAQIALARAMVRIGVRPYYLHFADPVAGAGHFRLPLARAVEIVRGMYGKVSGFAIPRLVVDLPGGKGKVPLEPDFEIGREGSTVTFRSPIDGSQVPFVDPGEAT